MVAVRKAHDLDPKFFPGPETNRPSKKIQGLFTEDINRFFVLASYIRARYRNDKKSTTGKTFLGNVGPNQRKGWSKHQPVIPSLFRYTAGPRQPNTAESEAQRHAMEVMTMMRRQAARPDLVKVKGDVGEGDVDKFDATFTSFAKPKKGGKAIRKKKGGRTQPAYRGLPAIDEKIRNAAIRALYAGLKVIYDRTEIEARTSALADDDDQETRKFATMLADLTNDKDIEGSAKKVDIEADHRAAFDESKKGADKLAEMVKLYGLSEDELLGASFEEAVKLSQDKHIARLFRLFQDSINSVSAGTLTFDEVVAQFGLDVERLADDTPVVDHHGIKLLPHQVIGIGFIFNMLRSNLRSCLLADETGLGKTIQALTADDFINADIKDALEADGCKCSRISSCYSPFHMYQPHISFQNLLAGKFALGFARHY